MKLSSLQEFDGAEVLGTPEALAAYIGFAFETGSAVQIKRALCLGARTRGLASLEEALLQQKVLSLKLALCALGQLGIKLTPQFVTSQNIDSPDQRTIARSTS
ncbi:hypothetical protein K6V90_25025 [Cupriavidus pauculus]|uniref:hypothetical protein n=1 Tax=Cupriavidus pauculus TaxID=82633 RepID=UPI001C936CE1|nr:hypothetical protein [Cupriavidus pauculus]MBY4733806.1 hypothetical protein [Cupriavidus pauculus]